ncbi:ModD protein [Desulfobacter curvatus]|uniref:ModD protein n=1 Tax=Desulfobacter curvatus TaxID=2290 RepID=UPI00035FF89F|nr:ModD protein [Desulfobacter curvatus]
MTYYIPDHELCQILDEDIQVFDLTSHLLQIPATTGKLFYKARTACLASCTEEVARMLEILGLTASIITPSGVWAEKQQVLVEAVGPLNKLHVAWRSAVKILEYCCAVSTRAHKMLQQAQKLNPNISLAITRKNIPGSKKLALKAILCAGAYPHRMGLHDSILIFREHMDCLGGRDAFLKKFAEIRSTVHERKIGVEAHNIEEALLFASYKFDFIQLDKFKSTDVQELVPRLHELRSGIVVVAAGGINLENVEEYAGTGVDVIASSSVFHGKPADIGAEILPELVV